MNYPGTLHAHSDYSNLRLRDSISTYEELIDYAISIGNEVIAITDHEAVCNAIKVEKYYKKIKEKNPNFKVILGNEIYLVRDGLTLESEEPKEKYYHFILLAKDAEGHKQIRELSTRAWTRSFTSRKQKRVPTYYSDLLEIIATNKGHVIGSTACLGGFLDQKLLQYNETKDEILYEKILGWVKTMSDIFGEGNFYLELQPSNGLEQIIVNKELIILSKKLNIPYIITTDSHYTKKEDAVIHKAFLNAQDGEREVDSFYGSTYLMDTVELEKYFPYFTKEILEEAYKNILTIKENCKDFSLLKPLEIPSLKWIKPTNVVNTSYYVEQIPYLQKFLSSDYEGDKVLARAIISKLNSDTRLKNKEIYKEININLESTWISSEVNNAHWSAYFLNLQKIIEVCWEAGTLVGPGRGSGVGFILLFLLDIIQINPKWESSQTKHWRFLNPERVSVLDIDTDIESGRRADVLAALREEFGVNRVANVITFGTEKSKSAIQTAARGLGIDVDEALYISSLIPADRGMTRTLYQCYYGDEENDFKPVPLFVQEMNRNPRLWQVAQKIEGLVCRMGEHAGGVIFTDKDFTESTSLMRAPNGDIITAFDLHDCEDASLIKIDLLSVEALDKMHACIDLLCDHGYAERRETLKETYEEIIGIYNLERTAPDMWKLVWEHKIQALFQMEQQSGIQGIALTKPKSVDELATLNSVIRLMAQEKGQEQPLNKYARYKNDISLWYKEMEEYGLTKEEQALLEPIVKLSFGICESQEKFMQIVQMPECGGFSLTWADSLRKSIAKKNPAAYLKLQDEYFKAVREKGLSENLCYYVWNVLVATSRGYGFNESHTLAYSLIALQEMNLYYKYPGIFWDCACLISDSGGSEDTDNEGKSANYDKIAAAIGKMRSAGIHIALPHINKSSYTFEPDVETNRIIFGLKGMTGVGDEIVKEIIVHRPYKDFDDFMSKVKVNKTVAIALIKSGAFDEFEDRKTLLYRYLYSTADIKKVLNLRNFNGLAKANLLPEELSLQKSTFEFNKYLKAVCLTEDKENYLFDERAEAFYNQHFSLDLLKDSIDGYIISVKDWDKKCYQKVMDKARNYISEHQEELLEQLNSLAFAEVADKYAKGNLSSWEMETLCFYYHEHELSTLNFSKYGIDDYFSMPTEPRVERIFYKGDSAIKLFEISKIAGTCIAKNKGKSTVTLLTTKGVVTVKFNKELFAMYDKQISEIQADGTKKVKEKSWFNRGSKVMIQGFRRGDEFVAKKYASTPGHHIVKISSINTDGEITIQEERYQGGIMEDEE